MEKGTITANKTMSMLGETGNIEQIIRQIVREEIAAHEERLLKNDAVGKATSNYINDQTKMGRHPIQI